MPADPETLQVGAAPGKLKNTYTGLRSTFPNYAIHTLISEHVLEYRKALGRRNEFASPGLWEGPLVTFVQEWLTQIVDAIRERTHRDALPATTPLKDRIKAREEFVARMVSTDESLEDIALDPAATHGDRMLQPANPRVQTLTFDWSGNDAEFPQPTPGRIKDPSARVLITGVDVFTVEMTNSPSSNGTRTINANDAAIWISWIADLFNVAKNAAIHRTPYIPESLSRGQYDHIWNADGAFDRQLNDGDGQFGEQTTSSNAPVK